MEKKFKAEAKGIEDKAAAMKKLDGVGKDHEEVELASIAIQKDVANAQAEVIKEGLKAAKIDIVGGDDLFFNKLISSITNGKSVDRTVDNSHVLSSIKETFFNGDPEHFSAKLRELVQRFGVSSEDLKNLTISALVTQLLGQATDDDSRSLLSKMASYLSGSELADKPASVLNSRRKAKKS